MFFPQTCYSDLKITNLRWSPLHTTQKEVSKDVPSKDFWWLKIDNKFIHLLQTSPFKVVQTFYPKIYAHPDGPWALPKGHAIKGWKDLLTFKLQEKCSAIYTLIEYKNFKDQSGFRWSSIFLGLAVQKLV